MVDVFTNFELFSHLSHRYDFCDIYLFKNASFYTHNFGQCNLTEFDSKKYTDIVLKNCTDEKKCTPECKSAITKMDQERCMKGYMRKIYDDLLYMHLKDNGTTYHTLTHYRALCAQDQQQGPKDKEPGSAVSKSIAMETIAFAIFASLVNYFKI